MPATGRFLFGVLRRVLREVLSRAPREALVTAALHALMTRLMRVPMDWAFRAAGFAMMGEVLTQAMCEAMAGVSA
jgi:hypothetical protein